jgi:drug/metabolite transporter (DMT)-like permease
MARARHAGHTARMQDIRRGTWEMACAMAISGTIGWLVVSSGQRIADLLFWRCLLGALTLLAFCAALGLLKPLPRRVLLTAAVGGVAIVGNWMLLFASYAHASISVATVVYNTQPFMLLALGVLVLRERVGVASVAWLGLAFGGVLLVAQAKATTLPAGAHYGLGILLALGAAFLYAVAALVAKKLKGVAPQLIALVQMCVGTAMLAPWALQSGWPATPSAWAHFAAIGVVYTGVMYILLYGALQRLPTATAGTLSFLYPLVAVLVDHLAFGVRLGPLQWAGATAILAAVAGMQWWPARPVAAAR